MASILPFNGDIEHAIIPGVVRSSALPAERVASQDEKNVINVHITSSAWLQRWMQCDFPLFSDVIMEAYHEHSQSNINPYIFAPIMLLYASYVFFRSGLLAGFHFGEIQMISLL